MNSLFSAHLISLYLFTVLLFNGVISPVFADDERVAWRMLKEGKAVAIMRHAIAPQTIEGKASQYTRDICQGERNLSQQGRDQAEAVGDLFRKHGILIANVYSSSLCRNVDTAELLGFGPSRVLSVIDAYHGVSNGVAESEALTEWIKNAILTRTLKTTSTNILVTHGFNIRDLTNQFISQGDVLIVGMEGEELVVLLMVDSK